jgi:hypothetical protein
MDGYPQCIGTQSYLSLTHGSVCASNYNKNFQVYICPTGPVASTTAPPITVTTTLDPTTTTTTTTAPTLDMSQFTPSRMLGFASRMTLFLLTILALVLYGCKQPYGTITSNKIGQLISGAASTASGTTTQTSFATSVITSDPLVRTSSVTAIQLRARYLGSADTKYYIHLETPSYQRTNSLVPYVHYPFSSIVSKLHLL